MWYIELGKTVIKANANFITNSQYFIKIWGYYYGYL